MCTGLEIAAAAAIVAGGVGAYTAYESGQQQQAQAKFQARETENAGLQAADEAKQRADRIRRAGAAAVSSSDAQLAASGVKLGEGTATEIDRQATIDYQTDAANELLTGKRQLATANRQAGALRIAGSNAALNGTIKAGTSLLSSAASTYSAGWGANQYTWGGNSGTAFDVQP